MKQKIEWYREVLELEPGSRVFFPLARLLAEVGQLPEAVATLYQGLLRHPDHIEARLLLVDFLHRMGDSDQLHHEVEHISRLFETYPSFWTAWGELLDKHPSMHDAALALRFFASALRGTPITWAGVIEHGLSSILQTSLSAQCTSSVTGESSLSECDPLPHFVEDPIMSAVPGIAQSPSLHIDEPRHASHLSPSEAAEIDEDEADDGGAEEAETDEVFSIRTRSMAEVLAEQGDYLGAADIYRELIALAAPDERLVMEKRMEELQAKPSLAHAAPQSDTEKTVLRGQPSRLADLLESLAQRLENRAR